MPNIEIDLNKALDLGLTLNQLVFIRSLSSNTIGGIKSFVRDIVSDNDVLGLINMGYLTSDSTKESASLSEKWYESNLDKYNDDWFKSFHERFPTSVTRPDGSKDYLRTNLNRCRTLYKTIVKDDYDMHLRLCKALDKEIELKRKNNKMSYFRRLDNWLKNECWLETEAIDDDKQIITMTYGTEIE